MPAIRYYQDDRGFPSYEAADGRYDTLGVFLTMDVQTTPTLCYDLLEMVDDVVSGREEEREWDGEGFFVEFTPTSARFRNNFLDNLKGSYPMNEVRMEAEKYWGFVAKVAGPQRCSRELALWEQTWERTHPYRGRLF